MSAQSDALLFRVLTACSSDPEEAAAEVALDLTRPEGGLIAAAGGSAPEGGTGDSASAKAPRGRLAPQRPRTPTR